MISNPTIFLPSTYSNGGNAAFVPSFKTLSTEIESESGTTIFPSTGIKAFTKASYSPLAFISAIVLFIEASNSELPFFTAIA